MAESDRTGGILTIDLGAVAANWRLLRDRAAPAECAAVVKADAYGLGMAEVAPALAAAGCRVFFVATLDEGIRLRSVLSARATGAEFPPPAAATIFLLNGAPRGCETELLHYGLIPVLNGLADVAAWGMLASMLEATLPAALQIDTGMSRLGLPPDDPLWAVPGIRVTPHIAAQPDTATVAAQFADNLQRLRQGLPLLNLVDRTRGY